MGRRVETVLGRVVVSVAIAMLAGCDAQMPISFNEPASSSGSSTNAPFCAGTGGSVTAGGGTLDCLSFAIVGDTRPPSIDDTAQYPSAIIGKIWQDVEAESPRPAFAITTGDYIFARANGNEANPQLDLYLHAQAAFSNPSFHAMGNHECTGATTSNCGTGNTNGLTKNYSAFLAKFLQPMGIVKPYYSVNMQGTNGAWTAKLVVIAANAWDSAQSAWLDQVLSHPTTYTFVVRHEPAAATTAPGATRRRRPTSHVVARGCHVLIKHVANGLHGMSERKHAGAP
jgi:hypothetical protein